MNATHIKKFETSTRTRDEGPELLFEFDDESSEGGNSGGPIFSLSGGVVAIIIDGLNHNGYNKKTKATDSKILMELVELNSERLTSHKLN